MFLSIDPSRHVSIYFLSPLLSCIPEWKIRPNCCALCRERRWHFPKFPLHCSNPQVVIPCPPTPIVVHITHHGYPYIGECVCRCGAKCMRGSFSNTACHQWVTQWTDSTRKLCSSAFRIWCLHHLPPSRHIVLFLCSLGPVFILGVFVVAKCAFILHCRCESSPVFCLCESACIFRGPRTCWCGAFHLR